MAAYGVQIFGELPPHFGMLERQRNGSLEVAYLASTIVTGSGKLIRQGALFQQ